MLNFLAYSQNVPPDLAGKLIYGLTVTIIGVLIVFAVLILIMFVISLFQVFFGEKKKHSVPAPIDRKPAPAPVPAVKPVAPVSGEKSEELVAAIAAATAMAQEELIVVLAAAVAAQEGCDPASSRYRIRSFRRIL